MDVYIVIENKNKDRFEDKAKGIINELKKHIKRINCVSNVDELKNKRGLCIIFSNNNKEIEILSSNKEIEIICITDRLESKYILAILDYTKDIYFSNSKTDEIIKRILGYIKIKEDRKRCIKGEINVFKK